MSHLRTLLLTDVVDSTKLSLRVGDAEMARLWAEHDRAARDLLPVWHGREIDKTDGMLLLFDAAADAVGYALAYQQALSQLVPPLKARAGLHVGPVTLRENSSADVALGAKPIEVEGVAKATAARVMSVAMGGQILLSADAQQCMDADGLRLQSHGHWRLKGLDEPIELFEAGDDHAPFLPPPDIDKAYRVVRHGELWTPVREIRHNLAPERDAFVGRGGELHALAQALNGSARFLTVLGPGGTGKTRFVCRYARAWLGDWPGGVYFCDLAEARSLDGVHFATALALDVPLGKSDPGVQLGHVIAGRGRCLLILDNFEQLVELAAATVGAWLDRAPDAAFVVTSRERLHLAGEQVFAVEPLELATEAVELFAARAQAQRPGFVLSADNHADVAEVVRLLDGLPLAIELAAARVRVLSPAQIVGRLSDRFRLLAGARGAAARQATLKTAIDWSWDLLSPWEQAALSQCSVFEGGFTLEAAEAVLALAAWPEAPPALDVVQALLDKSLLRSWVPAEVARLDIQEPYFGMYVSIHEYAAQRLAEAGASLPAQQRHGLHFATLGSEAATALLSGADGVRRLRALALETDNLVAACRRAAGRGEAAVAAATFCAAWEVLCLHGPLGLGVTLGDLVLALEPMSPAQRIDVLLGRADAAARLGRIDEARGLLGMAGALALQAGDRRRQGVVEQNLGQLDREQGHMDAALQHMQAALALHRETQHRLGQALVLNNLGNLFDQQGAVAHSQACHDEALAIQLELHNLNGVGRAHASLGILNRHRGRMAQAQAHYEAALAIHRQVGDRRSEGIALGNLANVHTDQGRIEEGRQHLEAALAIHREVGSRVVEGVVLGNLGRLHQQQGRPAQARDCADQALAISREIGSQMFEAMALGVLGGIEKQQGRFEAAREHLEQALAVTRAIGNRRFQGMTLGALGALLADQGQTARALALFDAGEAMLREINDPLELAGLLCSRGLADLAGGDAARARVALAEADRLAREIGVNPASELSHQIEQLRTALS